jgi:hypothetical protein
MERTNADKTTMVVHLTWKNQPTQRKIKLTVTRKGHIFTYRYGGAVQWFWPMLSTKRKKLSAILHYYFNVGSHFDCSPLHAGAVLDFNAEGKQWLSSNANSR